MQYFNHDTTAASDDLLMALRLEHGGAAVDCYWTIIEQIYREERPAIIGENRPETKALSVRLAIAYQVLIEYVQTMISYGLLVAVENLESDALVVTSTRAEANIKAYRDRCETARLNGAKGGRKSRRKATANQSGKRPLSGSGSDSQANKIKENKVIGSHKGNLITNASRVADAQSAPRAAISCPNCGVEMERTGLRVSGTDRFIWRCPLCSEEVSE